MRRIYKFLDVDQQQLISDKLYQYVTENSELFNRWGWTTANAESVLDFVPELEEELAKVIKSKINMITILRWEPLVNGPVHLDTGKHIHRVLWPVINCAGSYTKFYDTNGNKIRRHQGRESYLEPERKFPLKEIESIELLRPMVFNTKICHGAVINPKCLEPRITCTIGFEKQNLEDILMA